MLGNCAANSLPWFDHVTVVPAVLVADVEGSVMFVLPLVMVSSGRKMVPVPCVFVQISVELLLCKACKIPAELQGGRAAAVTGLGRLQLSLWGKWAPSPVQIKGFPPCFGVMDQQGSWIPCWELQKC